jgi:signal transduction histidine kinase
MMSGAVLIVDDSAADRALMRTILGRAGYTVHEVAKGRDVVAQARRIRPHVVILDVNLPDMSGLDVCRSIRADREIANVPVLMLTVRHDDADVVAGLEAGADEYVVKDAAGEIILGRVRRLIEFRQMSGLAMLNQQLAQAGRLLTGIVHEIRGPLSVIRGNAELLRMDATGAEQAQWIDSIIRSTRILQVRLDHLMAAVRDSSSEMQLIDPGAVVRESVDLFVKGLPPDDHSVPVEVECRSAVPRVHGDAGRLMQVLINVLSNAREAIRRNQREGRIVVRTGTTREEGRSWVTIDVIDDGPGIPESFLGRIFEPFFTTREEGTGYGLYLAAEILKEQSGRITARNNPDRGVTFTLWLPEAGGDAEASGDGIRLPGESA